MPLFDKFFNSRKFAPVDNEKSSGGSSSSYELKKYENLEADQTWEADDGVGGLLRIHIDCIDPPSVKRYGFKYREEKDQLKFYDDIAKLKQELADGQFTLNLKSKKKKQLKNNPQPTPEPIREPSGNDVVEPEASLAAAIIPEPAAVEAEPRISSTDSEDKDPLATEAKDPVLPKGEQPKPGETGSEDLSWRKELDDFLARAEGPEAIKMLKNMIVEEWSIFDNAMYGAAHDQKTFISRGERARLWNVVFLPQLKEMIGEYFERQSLPRKEGTRIFKAILVELEKENESKG